jgi:hypothetical protein
VEISIRSIDILESHASIRVEKSVQNFLIFEKIINTVTDRLIIIHEGKSGSNMSELQLKASQSSYRVLIKFITRIYCQG